jgi:hypothetical protein
MTATPCLQTRVVVEESRARADAARHEAEKQLRFLKSGHEATVANLETQCAKARGALGESITGQREAERQAAAAVAGLIAAEDLRQEAEQ